MSGKSGKSGGGGGLGLGKGGKVEPKRHQRKTNRANNIRGWEKKFISILCVCVCVCVCIIVKEVGCGVCVVMDVEKNVFLNA